MVVFVNTVGKVMQVTCNRLHVKICSYKSMLHTPQNSYVNRSHFVRFDFDMYIKMQTTHKKVTGRHYQDKKVSKE